MTEYDATEQAYKRGYEQGVKDFAERVQKKSEIVYGDRAVCVELIDQIAKEMGANV